MSNKDQTSSNNNSKLKTENVKLENSNNPKLKQFLQSKQGQYSLISVLVLGVLLISGLFTYNILKQDDTAQAANTLATAFNPSDCTTYTANGGTTAAGVCFVKLYEKNGQLFKSLDITAGEVVKVRNYYNNTTVTSVTSANITDSMPTGFTRVGNITNNYVDASPVTLNNNVFTGQNLSVAPGAGYFGYAADNSLSSSALPVGVNRYIHFKQCATGSGATYGAYWIAGVQFNNTASTPFGTCATLNPSFYPTEGSTISLDLYAQNRLPNNNYLNMRQCAYNIPSTNIYPHFVSALYLTSNGTFTDSGCPLTYPIEDSSTSINLDTATSVEWRLCTDPTETYHYVSIVSANTAYNCPSNTSGYTRNSSLYSNNTKNSNRGHGYIGYTMQATGSFTNNQQVGTTGTLNAGGAKTSGVLADLTITNVPTPNISYTKLYSVDGGTTWSPTVSANPGQSVLVRLWNENTGGASVTEGNIKDSLPATFTYVAGSAKNCLNPSTTTVTSPDNSELVCDTGTPTQKDSLFSTLTNASGVSPSAGLYDGASASVATGGTAFNAVAGTKEIGKFRYLNISGCSYGTTTTTAATYNTTSVISNGYGQDPTATNTADTLNCADPAPSVLFSAGSALSAIDTLDSTRSKSYIQYEMIIPAGTAGGNYGTTSTISSTATTAEFTPVTSGANGSGITVTGDPAFSVKKLLALPTSGTGSSAVCPTSTSSYSTSLSNTAPGATICVRLAYQNKTAGAVNNAAITDTLSSGFTYINNSTSNCLTPATGSELCSSDSAQAGAGWTGNNGWTGSNFALAPHAGLYGQSATGATSVMEMGKKGFFNYRECSYLKTTADYILDRFLFDLGNTAINTFNCASTLPATYVNNTTGTGANPQSVLATRYLHMRSCSYASTTITDTNLDQFTFHNNTANATYDCTAGILSQGLNPPYDIIGNGGTDGVIDYDMLSNRYVHIRQCSYTNNTNGDTILDRRVIAANNVITDPYDCNSFSLAGYVNGNAGGASSYSYDLLDPANGTGYIQYKVTSPLNPSSASVTLPNVSLSGTNQTTSTGNATINFNIPATGCTVNDPCALFDTALTYSPTQALAKRYGGSGSSTADNLILTLKDTRLEQPSYTTTCTFRYKFKSDTTWRSLSSSVAYNNSTGCNATLLKADQLFWNVDFEITAVTTSGATSKNYLLYSNYDFKAGSIGVTSIGGSGL